MLTKPLDPGRLGHRIALQQRAAGVTPSLGEPSGAWATVVEVWAQAIPLTSREFFASGQMQQTLDVRFIINWRAGVSGSWRVLWRGEPYDLVGEPVDVDASRTFLELRCVKGTRDGR